MPLAFSNPALRFGVAFFWFAVAIVARADVCVLADSAPSQTDLDNVTARGAALFEYDLNAARATDAMLAASPVLPAETQRAGFYVGRRSGGSIWVFEFGALGPDGKFLVAFVATQKSAGSKQFDVVAKPSPGPDDDFFARAARAAATARGDFSGVAGYTYNYAVLPTDDGQFNVYLYPAQRAPHVYPLGGDERYRVSGDGATVIDKHRMHRTVLESSSSKSGPNGETPSAVMHSDIFSTIPEDTDVFNVLIRRPPLRELVVAGGRTFEIATDGKITDMGLAPQR